jgi:putative transcriptional regulator
MIRNKLSTMMGARREKMSDLVRATGINKNTIHSIYHERSKGIDFVTMEKICRHFDCQTGDLFYITDDPQPEDPKK